MAAEVDLPPKTIRYYEAIGLLRAIRRSRTGYRQYSRADCDRLRFILNVKQMELTLGEISDILSVCDQGEPPCSRLAQLLNQKIAAIDEQVRTLTALRRHLMRVCEEALRRRCALRKSFGRV